MAENIPQEMEDQWVEFLSHAGATIKKETGLDFSVKADYNTPVVTNKEITNES